MNLIVGVAGSAHEIAGSWQLKSRGGFRPMAFSQRRSVGGCPTHTNATRQGTGKKLQKVRES
jgi:hypothetical protein